MSTFMSQTYSNILHNRAAKWNLPVPADRPLIDDDTSPYPCLTVAETLRWDSKRSAYHWVEISLVTLNNQWSYTAFFILPDGGMGWGPSLKFCDPFPTRTAALAAACELLRRNAGYLTNEISPWLNDLTTPRQFNLFEETV